MGTRRWDVFGKGSLFAPSLKLPLSHAQPYRESLKLCHSLETGFLQ